MSKYKSKFTGQQIDSALEAFQAFTPYAVRIDRADDGNYYLQIGKEYKIYSSKTTQDIYYAGQAVFSCDVQSNFRVLGTDEFKNVHTYNKGANITIDEFADNFTFRLLCMERSTSPTELHQVYEVGGERYEVYETIREDYIIPDENQIKVSGASEVYELNADAMVKSEKGDSVFIRYSGYSDGSAFTEEWTEGQSYIGFATGMVAPTDKDEYIWSAFNIGPTKETEQAVDRLKSGVSTLEYFADGNLCITDNNFPMCSGDGYDSYYEHSAYGETAYVTSLIIGEDQPDASYVCVWSSDSSDVIVAKGKIPENICWYIKNWRDYKVGDSVTIDLARGSISSSSVEVNPTVVYDDSLTGPDIREKYPAIQETWCRAFRWNANVQNENSKCVTKLYTKYTKSVTNASGITRSFNLYHTPTHLIVSHNGNICSNDEANLLCQGLNLTFAIRQAIIVEPFEITIDTTVSDPWGCEYISRAIYSGTPDTESGYLGYSCVSGTESATHCGSTIQVYKNRPVIKAFVKNDIMATLEDHESRITAIEAALCLQEGTQILMADGTTKNIEDVKYGDMIMTWDIDNNCTIPCKSYGSIFTGYSTGWQYYCFDNGSVLKIQQNHRIYKANKQIPVLSTKWRLGDQGIASNGELATFYYAPKQLPEAIERRKYSVFSETGLYFANNILCGHLLSQPLNVHQRTHGGIKLSKEEQATLLEYATARDQEYLVELQYPDYMQEALPYCKQKEKSEMQIAKYKKKLSDRDYKTIKASQGKLTDEEIAENIEICDELRLKIRAKEEAIITCDAKIQELRTKYDIRIRPLAEIETENIKKAIAKARDNHNASVESAKIETEPN